jgi:hypothetical protein
MDNLRIYNKYREVPKEALKPFDNGNFKGTDINTMWRIKCLTEEFGACGIGWAYDIVRTWTENGCNGELLCFAEIKLFIKVDGEWSRGISAVGGSKLISYIQSKQYSKNSDEGYKMAITDALGVACKLLGFGADVYWANDKTKYTVKDDDEPQVKPIQNTHKTPPKTDDKPKIVGIISRSELVQKDGVSNPEKTIAWLEDYFGKKIGELTESEAAEARGILDEKKRQRDDAKRKAALEKVGEDDLPFPLGD